MSAGRFTAGLMLGLAGLVPAIPLPVQAQESSSELLYQVQALLEEVRELRGQVESQQRDLENLRRRQRDQYLDLDQRLQRIEQNESSAVADVTAGQDSAPPTVAEREPMPPATEVPEVRQPIEARPEITPLADSRVAAARDLDTVGEAEQAAYDRAFAALRETRYADAADGFSDFLDQYPDSPYAVNALYWLAETYYVTRDFTTALRLFGDLIDQYPESGKQGDALLKLGFTHYELENWNEARAALEQVRSQYPGTTLARLAESRLRDMRLAGHY
ncbi:MAG: tol-pal system protein YbgF [Pseudomonadota bacterium]|nr:MAG: tol-pal system protein YbgF [Pseudomonadota bacterium]